MCKRPKKAKKGPAELCTQHYKQHTWDKDEGYLRQVKHGGKWAGVWPTQAKIAKELERMGYKVDQEVRPLWATSLKGVLLPFDIALPELQVLLEYQGEQHSEYIRYFFRSKKRWRAYLLRQARKKRLVKENGWYLVEISHKDKPIDGWVIWERIRAVLDAEGVEYE